MFLIAIALYYHWYSVGGMHENLACTMILLLYLGILLVIAGARALDLKGTSREWVNDEGMVLSEESRSVYLKGSIGVVCAILSLALGSAVPLLGVTLGILAIFFGVIAVNRRVRYGRALGIMASLLGLAGYLMVFYW